MQFWKFCAMSNSFEEYLSIILEELNAHEYKLIGSSAMLTASLYCISANAEFPEHSTKTTSPGINVQVRWS